MQKKFLWIVLGLLCVSSFAQDRKNSLKFLPVNFYLNSLSFEYERMISPNSSLEFGLALPVNKPFIDRYTIGLEDEKLSNDELGILCARAGFRHYTGSESNSPKGFYYAPYVKYQSVNSSLRRMVEIEDDVPSSYDVNYDVNVSTLGFGLQFGYQFLIAQRISLDLYFLGLEAGWADLKATIKPSDASHVSEVDSDMQDTVNDMPTFINKKIQVSSNSSAVTVNGNGIFYPWFRAGFSIGVAF